MDRRSTIWWHIVEWALQTRCSRERADELARTAGLRDVPAERLTDEAGGRKEGARA